MEEGEDGRRTYQSRIKQQQHVGKEIEEDSEYNGS